MTRLAKERTEIDVFTKAELRRALGLTNATSKADPFLLTFFPLILASQFKRNSGAYHIL